MYDTQLFALGLVLFFGAIGFTFAWIVAPPRKAKTPPAAAANAEPKAPE